jgi:GDP-D-mannose dehydratase
MRKALISGITGQDGAYLAAMIDTVYENFTKKRK